MRATVRCSGSTVERFPRTEETVVACEHQRQRFQARLSTTPSNSRSTLSSPPSAAPDCFRLQSPKSIHRPHRVGSVSHRAHGVAAPPKGEPSETIVYRLLQQDCAALLNRYKPLMFDHRLESRLPLSPSSWPNFGQPFDYIHFSLASNSRMFDEFVLKMRSLWQDMQRADDLKLFALGDYSRMDEVVDALQEAAQVLKELQAAR